MPAPQTAAAPAAPAVPAPAAPVPAAPSAATTGTPSARRLLRPESAARPLTLWGSSSMSSEGGAEATALPIRIHEHLALSAAPAPVHAFGVGATRSPHTLLMRGLDTPALEVLGDPDPATGEVRVALDPGLDPAGPLRVPGRVDGTAGMLDGSSGSWLFTPAAPAARIDGGTFASSLAEIAEGSRQVLWAGKNNILDVPGVLEDTRRLYEAVPEGDSLVLGHWCTERDARGSTTGEAVAEVNAELAARHGEHFLDLQRLLTDEEGLSSSPLAPLQLLEQGTTLEALGRAVVPPLLVAADGIHLNGWGNLVASWAIVRRMRELQWL
ncbi:hypothetical protein ACT3SP_01120 [Brachybacterium sp. AOP43-C2-M15]|uniref:hypothetical protein n=1 Tax=Brachybacterium sp. AOP43-C2-M15 TaxID=3457661 RepID=UPI0040345BC7